MGSAPTQKLSKQRVLIWSGDNVSTSSYTNITVQLAQPLQQVVYAEWVSSSIPGYCVHSGQFPNTGQTSRRTNGNSQYWRFINSSVNFTDTPDTVDTQWSPQNINNLSFKVFNPDGSTPTLTDHWMLEIDFWCAM
jgi:hypothetical protein